MTRAHTIVENLVTAIQGITPDEQSGSADKFRHSPGLDTTESNISRDRSFAIAPISTPVHDPRYIGATNPPAVSLELGLGVAYQNTRSVSDRVLKDSERILDELAAFQNQYSSQILEVNILSGNIIIADRTVIVEFMIQIIYVLTFA